MASAALLVLDGSGWIDAVLGSRSASARSLVGGQVQTRLLRGEWWRLFTSVLLHADGIHLAVNVLSIWGLGRMMEPWVGSLRFLTWFAVGGVGGSLASWAMGLARSDGASGGAFALLGAAIVLGLRHRQALDVDDRRLFGPVLWLMTLVNLVLSLVLPFVDATSHVGGLVAGLVLGALPRGRVEARIMAIILGIFVGVCAFGWVTG